MVWVAVRGACGELGGLSGSRSMRPWNTARSLAPPNPWHTITLSVYYNSSKLKCKCNFSLSTCIFNQCLTRTNPSFLGAPNQNPIGSSNWVCVEMCLRIHLGSAFGGRESQSMPLQSILSLKIIIRKRVSLIKHIILWAFVVMSCPHLHYIF